MQYANDGRNKAKNYSHVSLVEHTFEKSSYTFMQKILKPLRKIKL